MYNAVYVVKPPTDEPVSVALARLHARIDQAGDDQLIAGYISAARTWVEQYLGRALITQQLVWIRSFDLPPNGYPYMSMPMSLLVLPMWFQWPLTQQGATKLPWEPVISVDEVSYGQWGKPEIVLARDQDYEVDIASARIRIRPHAQVVPNDHLQVKFTVGYGDNSGIPAPIITAILMLVAFLYEGRGDVGSEMPAAITMLLAPYRLIRFG